MRKTSKLAMILSLSFTMALSVTVGAAQINTKANADAATVTTNDGRTTDFVDYWWGGSAMSSVLNADGETVWSQTSAFENGVLTMEGGRLYRLKIEKNGNVESTANQFKGY